MATQAGKLVIVTGFKELDAKLRLMPEALQKKFVRGALRKGGKRLTQAAKTIIKNEAYDTGALHKSIKVKSLKRKKGRIGIQVMPPRDVLFANVLKADIKRGGESRATHKTQKTIKQDYYPAYLEFGYTRKDGTQVEAVKPFRRALYDNAAAYRAYFVGDLHQFVNEQKVNLKITKSQGYTGRKFKK